MGGGFTFCKNQRIKEEKEREGIDTNFLIPLSLQADGWLFDIGIEKSEFVAKSQFLLDILF